MKTKYRCLWNKLLKKMPKFKKIKIIKKDFKKVQRESGMLNEDFISMRWLSFSFSGVLFDSSCMNISALIEQIVLYKPECTYYTIHRLLIITMGQSTPILYSGACM